MLGAVNARSIRIPTLIVENDQDSCFVSTPEGAASLAARFGASATMAHASSSRAAGDACGPMSPHGYLGIEGEVIGQIVNWISGQAQPWKRG